MSSNGNTQVQVVDLDSYFYHSITGFMKGLPVKSLGNIMESIVFAERVYNAKKTHKGNLGLAISEYYSRHPDLLEEHLVKGPYIEKRLEELMEAFPEGSYPREFAEEHIEAVGEYNRLLPKYAAQQSDS